MSESQAGEPGQERASTVFPFGPVTPARTEPVAAPQPPAETGFAGSSLADSGTAASESLPPETGGQGAAMSPLASGVVPEATADEPDLTGAEPGRADEEPRPAAEAAPVEMSAVLAGAAPPVPSVVADEAVRGEASPAEGQVAEAQVAEVQVAEGLVAEAAATEAGVAEPAEAGDSGTPEPASVWPAVPAPVTGDIHHVELWVPNLDRAILSWGLLLTALGYRMFQDWPGGRSWRSGSAYIVVEQSPARTASRHDRCRPGLNHLAFHVASRQLVDELTAEALLHGWKLMFTDLHPYAGGPQHYAAYLENADGYEAELVAG